MGQAPSLSTTKHSIFSFLRRPAIPVFKPFFTGSAPGLGAALEPHSSDVLAGDWEVQDVQGEPPLSVASDPSRSPVWVIDRDKSAAASCRRLDSIVIGSVEAAVSCVRSGATLSARGPRLDQARPRAHRSRVDAAVDLGNEPPLSVDGGTGGVIDRRRVSVQWFSGTILTGVCGAALMGGAVFASLDGETNFATCRSGSRTRSAAPSRDRRQARQPQERPAAAGWRKRRHPPGAPDQQHHQNRRPRNRANALAHPRVCQPHHDEHGIRRDRAAFQSAEDAGAGRRRRRAGRRSAGRRARR